MKSDKKTKGKSPRPPGVREVQQNITESKQSQVQHQRDSEFHQAIIASATEGICACHEVPEFPYVRFTVWNPQMIEITGYTLEEINNSGWYQSVYPDPEVQARVKANWDRIREGDNLNQEEWEIIRKDGQRRQMLISTRVVPGGETGMNVLAVMNDITERKRTEEALRESEEKYRVLFDTVPVGIGITDLEGTIYATNRSVQEITGYTKEEFKTINIGDMYVDPDEREQMLKVVAESGQVRDYEVRLKRKDGTVYPALLNIDQVELEGRKVFLSVLRDITERKRAEEALRQAEENFRRSLDDSPLGVRIETKEGKTLYANRAIVEIYGYDSIEELRTIPVKKRYTPESYAEFQIREEKRKRGDNAPYEYEISIVRKNGEVRHLRGLRKEILWNGERQFQAVSQDITERKRAEEQIQASLKEKEVLLREVHHRVKNNFQVISSLLSMESSKTRNKRIVNLFTEARNKIHAMALIYSELYQRERFDQINMEKYLLELANSIAQTYATKRNRITVNISSSEGNLSVTQAIPCALVLNELISNAFKHAFQRGQKGKIEVSIQRATDDIVIIRVKDDGIGIPKEIDIYRTDTLGLKLVTTLVLDQLKGNIQMRRENGTEFIIEFKILGEVESG